MDGRVLYRGNCYSIHTPGPCELPELSFVVGVNVTTLAIDCIKQSIRLQDRFGDDDFVLPDIIPKCAYGTVRAINGTCLPSLDIFILNE